MRILIHALAIRLHGGTARHLLNFVPALGEYGAEHEYRLFVDEMAVLPATIPSNVTVYRRAIRSAGARVVWDAFLLPQIARSEGVVAIWNLLGFGALLSSVPQMMFQRAPGYYCRHYWTAVPPQTRAILHLRRWWQYVIMQRTAHIITPTAAMRDMVRAAHPDLPSERFSVIPHAYHSQALAGDLTPELQTMMAGLPPTAVKLLYVGHILPYKDLFFLLDVFAAVQQNSPHSLIWLLTISREDWPTGYDAFLARVRELGLTEQVKILGKLPGPLVGALYRVCDIVLFPSLCESFGWPMLEATSLAKPLFAADTAVNREVAGAGGCYYPVGDRETAVAQFRQLITNRVSWAAIGQLGFEHFQQTHLTWQQYLAHCHRITQQSL